MRALIALLALASCQAPALAHPALKPFHWFIAVGAGGPFTRIEGDDAFATMAECETARKAEVASLVGIGLDTLDTDDGPERIVGSWCAASGMMV